MEGGIMTAVQTSNPVHDTEGAVEAGIHEVGATIDAVEREVGRGVSTRFPLNSAFIFTFGALGGMLFGFTIRRQKLSADKAQDAVNDALPIFGLAEEPEDSAPFFLAGCAAGTGGFVGQKHICGLGCHPLHQFAESFVVE